MKRSFLLIALAALLLPAGAVQQSAHAGQEDEAGLARLAPAPLGFDAIVNDQLRILERSREPEIVAQVRVEQRVVVRISPSSNATRARLMAELPRRQMRAQFQEEAHGDCLAVDSLAGVQPLDDHRLLLITRDRSLLTATLEPSCSAQAFYSGFYVEQNDDGQLCVSRDQLQSRAGDACSVSSFQRLVAVRD